MSTSRIFHRRARSEVLTTTKSSHSLRSYLLPPSFLRIPFISTHHSEPSTASADPTMNRHFTFPRPPTSSPLPVPSHGSDSDENSSVDLSDTDSLFSIRSAAEPIAVAAHALISELEAVITQLVAKNAALRTQRVLLRAAIARLVRELNVERKRRYLPANRRTPTRPTFAIGTPSANSQNSSARTDVTPTPAAVSLGESSGGSGGSALGDLIAALQEKKPKLQSHYSFASRSSSEVEIASSSQLSRTRPTVSTDNGSRRPSITTVSSPPSARSTSTRNSVVRVVTTSKPKPRERLPSSPSQPHTPTSHTRTDTVKAPRTVGVPLLAAGRPSISSGRPSMAAGRPSFAAARPSMSNARPTSYQRRLEKELANVPVSPTESKTKIPALNNLRTSARRWRDTLTLGRKRSIRASEPA